MTIFDKQRLTQSTLQLDIEGLRRGDYSDQYFSNMIGVMTGARDEGYTYAGQYHRDLDADLSHVRVSDLRIEAQVFTRREPRALIAGIDAALVMLCHAAGYYEGDRFIQTWQRLEVEAVHDGVFVNYSGDPAHVAPVMKIRGRYQDFALLETPILGILSRASRVATNVYNVLEVSNGKPVLFFPARFDLPAVQPVDGYAYWLAVQRYNADFDQQTNAIVSTDAQGRWWGGSGGGTTPHALIAAFLGDTTEAMVAFARYLPVEVPRIALVDFDNHTIRDALRTLHAYWEHYSAAHQNNDAHEMRRWSLNGVRLDTAANLRDESLSEGDPTGVNAKLVRMMREALDTACEAWDVPAPLEDVAREFCRRVQIVVTGGFTRDKIASFERDNVPVDVYGVGSRFLTNDPQTNTDFTMDVVRVEIDGRWHEVAKVGRHANDNPDLHPVDLSEL